MRLHDDARKSVAFLGVRTKDAQGASLPRFGGTGFFVSYPAAPDLPEARVSYFVTARHVADMLAGPFVIGMNNTEGALELLDVDEATWVYHSDPEVDLAVVGLGLAGADAMPFPWEGFADNEASALFSRFGIGDLVYIVGLYRLFPGTAKISPVVHTGDVGMAPDEDIPIKNLTTGKIANTRGYLIEAQTLDGLSGSPVFVRYTNPTGMSSGVGRVVAYTDSIYLLGLWQGSWDGVPDDILAQEVGRGTKVPVGMGITIPARRITEVLQSAALELERADWVQQHHRATPATTDQTPQDGSAA